MIRPGQSNFVAVLTLTFVWTTNAVAEDGETRIPHWSSFVAAGERYGIDPLLLVALAKVESNFEQSARNINVDGSVDVGIMQINRKYWDKPLQELGIDWHAVETSPDININVGAWVLSQAFERSGVSWTAIGAYNAGFTERNKEARRRYAVKVYRAVTALAPLRSRLTAANTHVRQLAHTTY